MHVLGISGSLRRDSDNAKLLGVAADLLADDVELELWSGLKAVPPYDQDDEDAPAPSVHALREAVERADAVLFATPEYNHSVPGQLKNALDWLSRPLTSNPLRNKPVAVIGASSGIFGAVWAQAELRKVLAAIGSRVVEAEVAVGQSRTRFDEAGQLTDDGLRAQLGDVLEHLTAAARARQDRAAAASA